MSHVLPQVCLSSSAATGAGDITVLANDAIAQARHVERAMASPIDRVYETLFLVTQLAAESDKAWHTQHGLILAIAAVAGAEDYFRTLLTELVEVCGLTAERVKPMDTKLEFVFTSSVGDAMRAVLDRESFSSQETIKSWTKKIAGKDKNGLSLKSLLDEYERVCHVRHCAVHAGGYVSQHNARVLGVEPGTWISLGSAKAVFDIVAVVTAMVRAYNQELFEHVLEQWIDQGELSGNWALDRPAFTRLWQLFRSTRDIDAGSFHGNVGIRSTAYLAYLLIRPGLIARSAKT